VAELVSNNDPNRQLRWPIAEESSGQCLGRPASGKHGHRSRSSLALDFNSNFTFVESRITPASTSPEGVTLPLGGKVDGCNLDYESEGADQEVHSDAEHDTVSIGYATVTIRRDVNYRGRRKPVHLACPFGQV